jgi:hypothetical protein
VVLLFSTATGERLAIMPDRYLRRLQAGGQPMGLTARLDVRVVPVDWIEPLAHGRPTDWFTQDVHP